MNNKLIRLLLSFLTAFVLWFLVISLVYTETERVYSNIPIKTYGDVANGLQIISDLDDMSVEVKLSGNRFTLNKLEKSDIVVWANVSKISSAGEKTLSYEVEFLNGIRGVDVVEQKPAEIKVTVAQRVEKDISVKLDILNQDKMPNGFQVGKQELLFSGVPIQQIHISGPKSLVDQIAMAKITVDLDGATQDVKGEKQVALCDAYGNPLQTDLRHVTVSPSMLTYKIPVLMVKEIPLELSLSNTDQMPEDYVVDQSKVWMEYQGTAIDSIMVYGPKESVEKIASAKIVVDMTDKTGNVDQEIKPVLCNAAGSPLGEMRGVTIGAELVTVHVPVVLEQNSRDIPVEIEIINENQMADGFVVDRANMRLEYEGSTIRISGPKSQIDQIAKAKVIVNMAGVGKNVTQELSVTLCDALGNPHVGDMSAVLVAPQKLTVSVPVVQQTLKKTVDVQMPELLEGAGLAKKDVQVSLVDSKVILQGSPAALQNLNSIVLPAIDLSKEHESFVNRKYTVNLPQGVTTESGDTKVVIRVSMAIKPPMEIKTLRISPSQFELINLPEGMLCYPADRNLDVWVRGTGTVLSQILASDIKVTVDLSGATKSGYYQATIAVKVFTNVWVIAKPTDPNHTYQIYVDLVPASQITPGN